MKIHPLALVLAAQALALSAHAAPEQITPGCETMIRTAVTALESGYLMPDETTGAVSFGKDDLASVKISNVKLLSSSCLGPDDCDAKNPDQFTWGADIGKKGEGLSGKVVVSYHRGNCFVEKLNLAE